MTDAKLAVALNFASQIFLIVPIFPPSLLLSFLPSIPFLLLSLSTNSIPFVPKVR